MSNPQPVLAALADPTRRRLYERLNAQGPASASKLATEMPISRQAVAKHLGLLDSVGLVERETSGREVIYSAHLGPLSDVASWLEEVSDEWDERLERLRQSFQ